MQAPWHWWRKRNERRAQIEREAAALLDQYGPAAIAIARNSARQHVGPEQRRYWLDVARDVERLSRKLKP